MPWFRLEDSFDTHPKVITAGNEAVGLFVRCGTHAARHLTDGFIRQDVALLYGSTELAETLCRVKLWHRARGGWTIHDYLDYNPSREAVEKERALKADRQKRWLDKKQRRGRDASIDASKDDAPSPSPPRREAGTATPSPSGRTAGGRANPPGSPPAQEKPAWCGQCDEHSRQTTTDPPARCPNCHPLAPPPNGTPKGRHAKETT